MTAHAGATGAASSRPIVVIEDEDAIRDVVLYNLARAGYATDGARDGREGIELVRRVLPQLVILDLMLPEVDGLEVCRTLREDERTAAIPVIMLTARGTERDIVNGLQHGADDYVVKPFSTHELLARVAAVLRRGGPSPGADAAVVEHGDIRIDVDRHEVLVRGEPVRFTKTELQLLQALLRQPGKVLTRDRLVTLVMGDDAWITERTIDVHIRAVRRKLGPDAAAVIETVRGVGYRARDKERGSHA